MVTGKVKFFSEQRGFGFIVRDDNDAEVFVHHTSILMEGRRILHADDLVEFDVDTEDERGPRAINVKVVKSSGLFA